MKKITGLRGILTIAVLMCLFDSLSAKAEQIEFSLVDSFGRQVCSQDYEGVPVFLEFGACW